MRIFLQGDWYALDTTGAPVRLLPVGWHRVTRFDVDRFAAEHPGVTDITSHLDVGYWLGPGHRYHRWDREAGEWRRHPEYDGPPASLAPVLPNGILIDEPWPDTDDL